jgi:hypothetical protein
MSGRWTRFEAARVAAALAILACGAVHAACDTPRTVTSPTPVLGGSGPLASLSAEHCVNVAADGTAQLGPVALPNGTSGFGGVWLPVSLGGVDGEMASVLVDQRPSGGSDRGAPHLTLQHSFRTAGGDYFLTDDRAVCAPAGTNPATCHVNDVLAITSGTGVFAHASGQLRNHGTADFGQGTLAFSIRGRMCGDGL